MCKNRNFVYTINDSTVSASACKRTSGGLFYKRRDDLVVNINYPKPALSYRDQLKHLIQDKGLKIENLDNALVILAHENYYRLSGYMLDFLDSNDRFSNDVKFEDIYNIYKFDKELRAILFEIINDVEVYFKTQIANYFSLTYGPLGYRNIQNFNSDKFNNYSNCIDLVQKINSLIRSNPKNLIIKHHQDKYNGCVPLWAMVELMSLGNMSKFYANMKSKDKKNIARCYYKNVGPVDLESLYHGIAYFRNQCCHFSRLYNFSHTIRPVNVNTYFCAKDKIDNASTFYFIYILMLLNPNKELGERVIYKLRDFMSKSKIDCTKKYGFPTDWVEILTSANGYFTK